MDNTLTGTIEKIGENQQISDSFKKRELVITTEDQYPQTIGIDFPQAKGDLLNVLEVGEEVTVHFNVRGREWQGRYFVNLDGWKVDQKGAAQLPEPKIIGVPETSGDLPF